MSETVDQKKELARECIDAINDGDAETLRELVADDVVMHGQAGQGARGAESVVPAAVHNDAFPDSHLEVKEIVAEGDMVAVRMTFTGTHEGDMGGIPPTGEEIEIRVMSMYRIKDDQLVEGWFVEDDADTLQQLGLWNELTA